MICFLDNIFTGPLFILVAGIISRKICKFEPSTPKSFVWNPSNFTNHEIKMTLRWMFYRVTLYEKCANRENFWSVFSSIRTEYRDLRSKLRIQSEYYKIRTRKNSVFEHFSNSVVSTKPKGKPPYSVRILENTDQKKLRIGTLFKQCGLY